MEHKDTVKNLTRGSISKALIQMSLPLIASQFVQMAYNLIDTLWVSRLGIEAVTAVSTAGLLLFLAQGICMIVQTGAQVRIGMLLGKNDLTQAQVASGTSITLNWIIMLLYVLPVLIFRHSIVGFYHIQNEVIVSYTVSYLTITIISVLFMGYNYVLLGIYTAAGDSQTPFKYNLVGMILNVILDPVLIFGLLGSPALGSDGAGYATLFSQMVVSLLYALRVHRDRHLFREGSFRSRYRMSWEECKIILRYGFPAAIQTIINFRDSVNLPMYMGEIGHNTDEWQAAFCQTMRENNIGYTFWPYKKMDGSSFVGITPPENWANIVYFSEAPRATYKEIREARPAQAMSRKAMMDFIEACKLKNCVVQEGYIRSLGMK